VASFTNLQGKAFLNVELVKANLDGIVWRDKDDGLGQVNFSNLDPAFLDSLGIDASRRELAAQRASKSAAYDAAAKAQHEAAVKQYNKELPKWNAAIEAKKREQNRQALLDKAKALRAKADAVQDAAELASANAPTEASGTPEYIEAAMAQRRRANEMAADAKKFRRQAEAEAAAAEREAARLEKERTAKDAEAK
jgi:colicin import membrane protein